MQGTQLVEGRIGVFYGFSQLGTLATLLYCKVDTIRVFLVQLRKATATLLDFLMAQLPCRKNVVFLFAV